MAQRVVHQVVGVLAPGCVPAWLSDGFKGYLPAIVGHCGFWVHPERRQDQGPWPKPRWMPLPGLLYAQVIKQYRRKRLVGVQHHVVFGTRGTIAQVLAGCGWKINTAFVERLNLDIRQRVAAVGRKPCHDRLCWLTLRDCLSFKVFFLQYTTQSSFCGKKYAESPQRGRTTREPRQ